MVWVGLPWFVCNASRIRRPETRPLGVMTYRAKRGAGYETLSRSRRFLMGKIFRMRLQRTCHVVVLQLKMCSSVVVVPAVGLPGTKPPLHQQRIKLAEIPQFGLRRRLESMFEMSKRRKVNRHSSSVRLWSRNSDSELQLFADMPSKRGSWNKWPDFAPDFPNPTSWGHSRQCISTPSRSPLGSVFFQQIYRTLLVSKSLAITMSMRAVVYKKPYEVAIEHVKRPTILHPDDVIVKGKQNNSIMHASANTNPVTTSCICGRYTPLHTSWSVMNSTHDSFTTATCICMKGVQLRSLEWFLGTKSSFKWPLSIISC